MKTNKSENKEPRIDFKIDYFYEEFKKKRFKFLSTKKKRGQEIVSFAMYKRIISMYLKIYFNELFFIRKPHYFFFGGEIIVCKVSKFVNYSNVLIPNSITVLWYNRPLEFYINKFRMYLMNGKRNTIPKLKRKWMKENNVDELPLIKDKLKEFFDNKIIFQEL